MDITDGWMDGGWRDESHNPGFFFKKRGDN